MSEKMEPGTFIVRAIPRLRTENRKAIHSVYSGLSQAFDTYYEKKVDFVATLNSLVKADKIWTRPAKGGAAIYLPEDKPGKNISAIISSVLED